VRELALLFGLSQRTIQRALKSTLAISSQPGRELAEREEIE
jgi:hypothetical protein